MISLWYCFHLVCSLEQALILVRRGCVAAFHVKQNKGPHYNTIAQRSYSPRWGLTLVGKGGCKVNGEQAVRTFS